MLCKTCRNQEACLPLQLAKDDRRIRKLLQRLKSCELKNRTQS